MLKDEQRRILEAYQARDARSGERFFGYRSLAHVYRIQARHRETMRLLRTFGCVSVYNSRILDVGCGNGNMLHQFLGWGALPENLAGIELRPGPVEEALHLCPNVDVRCGSATELPWSDNCFDLVCQHTVFSSILDPVMKRQISAEMNRVIRPGGMVLWYDFIYDNPRNPDVKGIKAPEIQQLFPEFKMHFRRQTLAPFIASRLPEAFLPLAYPLLASLPFLRTHYLGLLIKPA